MEEVFIIKMLLIFFYWCNILLVFGIATLGIVAVMYLEQWRRRVARKTNIHHNTRVKSHDEM